MSELIYSIERVFGDYLSDGKFYNIPEYQRGYKWSSQQVEQLLNDISDFDTGGDEELFYCLQNITLVENSNKLNVVDGQQRLTTLVLLLAYLGKPEMVKGKFIYSVRKPSNNFIQRIIDSGIGDNILKSENFESFIEKSENEDYDYQDIYFMYSTIQTINQWFDEKKNGEISYIKEMFNRKLLKNVKLIVNKMKDVSEQELFMNLNAGRVQLDGADLVRAILITRVAKQEMEEYDSEEIKDVVRLNERRVRIGWELDEINAWWNKKDVKNYFNTFTSIKTGKKETIKFDKEKHPINLLYHIWAESKREDTVTLGLFEPKSVDALNLYISIISLHRTLKDWFEDREIYHYLGLLFAAKRDFKFSSVWEKWEKNATKDLFIEFLKSKIQEFVFGKEANEKNDETGAKFWLKKIKDYNSDKPTNWYGILELEKILLTIDVIKHSEKREKGIPLPFLKPRYFNKYKEDKEHIYPSTPKDIKTISNLSNPENKFNDYIKGLNNGFEEEKLIGWTFSKNDWDKCSDEDKEKKLNDLKEEIHRKRPINSIGNLVLLHLSINRGFGNEYYLNKRIAVINNTENGEYVRQHTLKVFVKETESSDLNNWTMDDIKRSADQIHDILKGFFKINTEEESNE